MKRFHFHQLLALCLGFTLSACAASSPSTPPEPSAIHTLQPAPTRTPIAPPVPTTQPVELDSGVVAIYHKQGCFQGVDDVLTVHSDGTLVVTDTHGTAQQSHTSADQLTTLGTLLAQPELAQVRPLYQAAGADLCVYTVMARRGKQPFTLMTMDGAEPPEIVNQLIKELERLRVLASNSKP